MTVLRFAARVHPQILESWISKVGASPPSSADDYFVLDTLILHRVPFLTQSWVFVVQVYKLVTANLKFFAGMGRAICSTSNQNYRVFFIAFMGSTRSFDNSQITCYQLQQKMRVLAVC